MFLFFIYKKTLFLLVLSITYLLENLFSNVHMFDVDDLMNIRYHVRLLLPRDFVT